MIDLIDQVTYCTWFLKTSEKIASFILINSEQERSHLTKINQNWVRNSGLSRQDTALRSLTVFDWWGLGVARASGARGGPRIHRASRMQHPDFWDSLNGTLDAKRIGEKVWAGNWGVSLQEKVLWWSFFFGYGVSYIVRYIYIVR